MIMNKKTLKKLEYNKITELLAEQASSPGGKILCSHLAPMTSLAEITTAQEQTAAAFTRIVKKGRLSFSGVYTVEDSLMRLEIGGALGCNELLRICKLLEVTNRAKAYGRHETVAEEQDCLDVYFDQLEPLSILAGEIRRCIIDEDEISDDASSTLKHIRRSISQTNDKGTSCKIHTPAGDFTVIISIPGAHMVYNALAGIAVGIELGLTLDEIKTGIEALQPVAGRNHMIETEHLTILDDCYNANPVSMKASLDVLSTALTRKVAILGDMFELGTKELLLHREVGTYAAEKKLDLLCCIGTLSKAMADGASEFSAQNDTKICYFETKNDFLNAVSSIIKEHDTILVKASHGMAFEEIVHALCHLTF